MSDELLREVDEDIRRERMEQLWKRYRAPLLTAVAVLVLATAGASYWQDRQHARAGEAMQHMASAVQAFEEGDYKIAIDQFAALAKQHSGEVRDIALLWQGRSQEAQGDKAAAIASWNALVQAPAPRALLWRDLACLRLMAAQAQPLAAGCGQMQDSPLLAQRQEWQAARLWQDGKTDEARAMLDALIDRADTSQTQRARAQQLRSAMAEGK